MWRKTLPKPSPHAVGAHEEDHVRSLLTKAAQQLGFELPAEAICFGVIKQGPYAKIGFGHDLSNKEYLLYPLARRDDQETEARLSAMAVSKLFSHLHEQHWRRLRDKAIKEEYQNPHDQYDGTILSRWLYRFARNHPDKTKRYSEKFVIGQEMRPVGRIIVGNHEIECEDPNIVLPMKLPETIRNGIAIRRLRELLDWPSCGDAELDKEIREALILKAEDHINGTTIQLIGAVRKPINGRTEDQWRHLRKQSAIGIVDYKGQEESVFDYEATLSFYRSDLNKIGIRTSALIPYHEKPMAED